MGQSASAGQPGDDPAFVRFDGIEKTYDGRHKAVRHLDLAIRRGEFLTLLGPSGSGKTTSLMMLAGFENPTAGHIYLNGRPIDHVPPHKRNIGMVFQSYALFPHMSVAENIAFPLSVRGKSRASQKSDVARALSMVRLEGFEDRRPAQLSGGQQQRVALARALVFAPELVLMDEPLGALDKQLREEMQFEISALHRRLGVTVIYVTHDQSEALTMSDRVAVFNAGRIDQVADPVTLYESPATAFVAGFVGENNAMPATVLSVSDGFAQTDAGAFPVRALLALDSAAHAGVPVVLSVRPERVQLNPAEDAAENRFSGEVADVTYLGDHWRVRISAHGRLFTAKCPNTGPGGLPGRGDTIIFGWRAADCRALAP